MTRHTSTDYFEKLMRELSGTDSASADRTLAISRRGFLSLAGIAGGGLALGFTLQSPAVAAAGNNAPLFNAYVQVRADGRIILQAPNPEIGQGVKTAMPMIVAEELDAAWEDVDVVQSPIDMRAYGMQFAGGSRSIPQNWDRLRQAGAVARVMLLEAAAAQWNVPVSELSTENSTILHKTIGRSASYGEFAEAAALLTPPAPQSVGLKDKADYKLLGKRITGVDNADIVTGRPLFGIDQRVPGMLYAVYEKCPAVGGRVADANLDHIRSLKGVHDAFVLEGNGNTDELMPGVAIVADSTWAAFRARRELQVEWDESNASKDSWSEFLQTAQSLIERGPESALLEIGDVNAALSDSAGRTAEGVYTHHFVAHAPLEPQNTLAHWKGDGSVEVWSSTQTPGRAITGVANTLGIAQNQVTLHQIRAGGGFGRRLVNDPVCEAAAISRHVGAPVKLQWSREDDTAHDFYRVGGVHAMKGAVDADGALLAFDNHLITFTENGQSPVMGGSLGQVGHPETACPNVRLAQTMVPTRIPCGAWRAPGSNTIAWAQQSFLGELAAAGNRDQLEFLLETLENMAEPRPMGMNKYRAMDVVRLAAEKADWGKVLPPGHGMGVAFYYSHAGHVAEVAEVSVDDNKRLKVHKVVVVADVGPIINLSGAEAMMQGSVVDALSTLMGQQLTFENGRMSPLNFDRYPLIRMNVIPDVAVHFIESDNEPTGLGEPAIPPLAPAVGNAIYMASGIRVRTMPLSKEGYTLVPARS